MPGYQHPCRYCDQFIPSDSNVCPLCGRVNPLGPLRCQKCRGPIQKGWQTCPSCGLSLEITCPGCGRTSFYGDYCEHCNMELMSVCSHCRTKQPLYQQTCIKCKKEINRKGN